MTSSVLLRLLLVGSLLTQWPVLVADAVEPDAVSSSKQRLPGTALLDWPFATEEAIGDHLMDEAHRFVEAEIAEARQKRGRYWERDIGGDLDAYERSIESNRRRFRQQIGLVDQRLPVVMERIAASDHSVPIAENERFRVYRVRWSVLEGVWGEGLLAEPKGASVGHAVVVPDAGQQPEQMIGLADGITTESQLARRLADRGLTVVIPALVSRERLVPEAMRVPREARERLARTQQTYREWLYRQAYHMGRHVIGYEVHKVLAAVEWLHKQAGDAGAVGVAGYGEGGLIAFHAAAASARIDAVLVSGYFDSREAVWREPIDRNVWAQLVEFGDAELATLVAPGGLVVEYSKPPQWHDAKGRIETPPFERVRDEFARIDRLIPAALQRRVFVHGAGGRPVAPGSNDALREFVGMLGAEANGFLDGRGATPWRDRAPEVDAGARNLRQVRQIQTHVQCLVRRSDRERERFFLEPLLPRLVTSAWTAAPDEPIESAQPLIERSQRYRDHFRAEVIGRFDEPLLPLRPRTRKRYETATWTGYDVVLDVHRHLFAWGGLLVPKEIRPGERRPVVVAQHGRARLPKHLIDADIEAYSNFAAQLAERGFVVFVPHNLYRGEERYRWLDRKANTVKASLYSFIIAQHEQILRWLKTLPFVDQQRIGLYGLSFGGQTALRVPAVLDGYALSICSGIFNQWTRKVASSEVPNSFLYTKEWEVPQFNMGNTFDHAEMVYLIFPRPFMVERGHYDRVGQDRWVAYEYAKVRRLYALAGKPERTAITFFRGGHSIRGAASFDFLHKHLRWPPPLEQSSEQITPGPSED